MTREEANARLAEISRQMVAMKAEAVSLCNEHLLVWENPMAGYGAPEQAYVKDPEDWRYSNAHDGYYGDADGWYSSNYC